MSHAKEEDERIDNKVYEYRVLRRLSQTELAKAVGVSKQTILIMEKGNYSPSLKLAFRLANYFGVPITDMFTYKKEGNKK
ncbi:helix-turn-helix transcriptional regulator [Agrilactobacillus composti]|uniref:helix-turn-helix transcriptional regulator n=1 Tax=Agrilactobacillus composti TaxID=398555 RepID=UPI000557C38D|nr:helix-turn-helix transcriptional regulator [Agrilactobacillus composti]